MQTSGSLELGVRKRGDRSVAQRLITSLGYRDERVRLLLRDCDRSVWNLGQQIHQIAHSVIHHLPVSGKTPEMDTRIRDEEVPLLRTEKPARFSPMIGLREVADQHLLTGLKLQQLQQILCEAFDLSAMSQRQQALGAQTQDLHTHTVIRHASLSI